MFHPQAKQQHMLADLKGWVVNETMLLPAVVPPVLSCPTTVTLYCRHTRRRQSGSSE